MASVKCTECGSDVSDSAPECPECGFPFDSLLPVECPQCKNLVVFSTDICPECGYLNEESGGRVAAGFSDDAIGGESRESADDVPGALPEVDAEDVPQVFDAPESEAASGALIQEETASLLRAMRDSCNNPSDDDYIINVIASHISAVKSDFVNNPMKAFVQILTELDKSNKENQAVVQLGFDALGGAQEGMLAKVAEITQATTEQSQENLSKSQELALTIVSEITALKEVQKAAVDDLSNRITQLAAQPAIASVKAEEGAPSANDTSDYVLYLCMAMLLFTVLNFFITIYAVKLLK